MSWKVVNLCATRRFGSPVRKQIIMFLADKASDDGSGIWCSKGTIQRHTELGESTVKRTINEFLNEGILIETGRRACKNGFTVVYRIVLTAVRCLEAIAEPDDETGSTADGVCPEPGTGSAADPVPRPQRTPNHPETIHKPPTREHAREAGAIWMAYPEDRRRDRHSCMRWITEALEEVDAAALLAAVEAYAQDSAGFTRSKVSFSDNWFRAGKWRAYVRAAEERATTRSELADACMTTAIAWIKSQHSLCRHLSVSQVQHALAKGLITHAEAAQAGFGPDGRHT
ncbi:MAG: hypothetical protein ACK5II_07680 [Paracoccus sp. (in: a-proteobacteria)]